MRRSNSATKAANFAKIDDMLRDEIPSRCLKISRKAHVEMSGLPTGGSAG